MGLLVLIYRNPLLSPPPDSPFTGHERVCVVNVEGPFVPTDNFPAAALVETRQGEKLPVLVPREFLLNGHFGCAGGSYAASDDGRWNCAVNQLAHGYNVHCKHSFYGAVPIHDQPVEGDGFTWPACWDTPLGMNADRIKRQKELFDE